MPHIPSLLAFLAEPVSSSPDPAGGARANPLGSLRLDWELLAFWSVRVGAALLVLVMAWVAASWLRRAIKNGTNRAHLDPTLGAFFANAARWGVLTLGVVTCLGVFGVQTASFAAVIAALGLAIGLAFQGTLSNIASGVLLLVFRPFKVGDSVVIAGVAGVVNEIDLFTTALDTADGRRVIVPNAQIAGAVIDNQSHHPRRRFEVLLNVQFDADPNVTEAALSRALRVLEGKHGYLPSPPPEVTMTDFGKASVGWAVRYWATREVGGAHRPELLAAIKGELDREGIKLAAS